MALMLSIKGQRQYPSDLGAQTYFALMNKCSVRPFMAGVASYQTDRSELETVLSALYVRFL